MRTISIYDGSLEFSENLYSGFEKIENFDVNYIGEFTIKSDNVHVYYSSYKGKIFILNSDEHENFFPKSKQSGQNIVVKEEAIEDVTVLVSDNCYANDKGKYLPEQELKRIELFIKYCANNSNLKTIRFRSGEEPTKCIELIKKIVNFSKNLFNINEFAIQSNFLFDKDTQSFLLNNFTSIHASIDGFPLIQQKHRNLNLKQCKIVEENVKAISDKVKSFVVHCTVSKFSNSKFIEIVDYFDDLGVKIIIFEPMGKAFNPNNADYLTPPDIGEFLDNLIQAKLYANKKKISIYSSILPAEKDGSGFYYCGGVSCSPTLTLDGSISTCDEHIFKKKNDIFIIGKIDNKTGIIDFDSKKIDYLKKRNILNLPDCKDCFLKFSCLGQCPYRTLCATGDMLKVNCKLCTLIKEKTKKYLLKFIQEVLKTKEGILINEDF